MPLSNIQTTEVLRKRILSNSATTKLGVPDSQETLMSQAQVTAETILIDAIPSNPDTSNVVTFHRVTALPVFESTDRRAYVAVDPAFTGTEVNPASSDLDFVISNWIPSSYAPVNPSYTIKVYVNGVDTPVEDFRYAWYFDSSAGMLLFYNNVPPVGSTIEVEGYQYTGQTLADRELSFDQTITFSDIIFDNAVGNTITVNNFFGNTIKVDEFVGNTITTNSIFLGNVEIIEEGNTIIVSNNYAVTQNNSLTTKVYVDGEIGNVNTFLTTYIDNVNSNVFSYVDNTNTFLQGEVNNTNTFILDYLQNNLIGNSISIGLSNVFAFPNSEFITPENTLADAVAFLLRAVDLLESGTPLYQSNGDPARFYEPVIVGSDILFSKNKYTTLAVNTINFGTFSEANAVPGGLVDAYSQFAIITANTIDSRDALGYAFTGSANVQINDLDVFGIHSSELRPRTEFDFTDGNYVNGSFYDVTVPTTVSNTVRRRFFDLIFTTNVGAQDTDTSGWYKWDLTIDSLEQNAFVLVDKLSDIPQIQYTANVDAASQNPTPNVTYLSGLAYLTDFIPYAFDLTVNNIVSQTYYNGPDFLSHGDSNTSFAEAVAFGGNIEMENGIPVASLDPANTQISGITIANVDVIEPGLTGVYYVEVAARNPYGVANLQIGPYFVLGGNAVELFAPETLLTGDSSFTDSFANLYIATNGNSNDPFFVPSTPLNNQFPGSTDAFVGINSNGDFYIGNNQEQPSFLGFNPGVNAPSSDRSLFGDDQFFTVVMTYVGQYPLQSMEFRVTGILNDVLVYTDRQQWLDDMTDRNGWATMTQSYVLNGPTDSNPGLWQAGSPNPDSVNGVLVPGTEFDNDVYRIYFQGSNRDKLIRNGDTVAVKFWFKQNERVSVSTFESVSNIGFDPF